MNLPNNIRIPACNQCGVCCLATEMEISTQDMILIEKQNSLGLKKDDFCIYYDGFFHLRNQDKHCIFYNPTEIKCEIYSIRPMGCKYYPIIYDSEKNKCQIDNDCPNHQLFKNKFPYLNLICRSLKKWIFSYLIK